MPTARESADGQVRNQRIGEILEGVPQDAEFLYVLYLRLRCEAATFPIAMKVAMNFVILQLQARAATDQVTASQAQIAAAEQQNKGANRLTLAAIVLAALSVAFGAIQAYAYLGAHLK